MDRTITKEQLTAFEDYLRSEEREPATIEKYLRDVRAFGAWAGGRGVTKELAVAWKEHLRGSGYAPATINSMLVAVNRFFRFQGWEGLRAKTLRIQRQIFRSRDRELTKGDYARLVETAQELGRERTYLLVKVFGNSDLPVQELEHLTVEAAQRGTLSVRYNCSTEVIRFPRGVCRELLAYAEQEEIRSGPIFLTRGGKPIDRSNVTVAAVYLPFLMWH